MHMHSIYRIQIQTQAILKQPLKIIVTIFEIKEIKSRAEVSGAGYFL